MVTENSVRSENTEVPTIREIMVATTMSSLFVALFALVASSLRTRAALQAEILALRHQLAVFQKNAPRLCLAKILSGANAFEISDIQDDETKAGLTSRSESNNVTFC